MPTVGSDTARWQRFRHWLRRWFQGGQAKVRHGGRGDDGDLEGWEADRKGRSGWIFGGFGYQGGPVG
jgi:hypothetical protein